MARWWKQIKQLVRGAEASAPTQPALHQPLTRHQQPPAEYERWQRGVVVGQLMRWIQDQYAAYCRTGKRNEQDEAIDFLNTPSTKGFVIHFDHNGYSLRDAEFAQLYLRERILELNYRTQVADSRIYSARGATERSDRYYFKPRLSSLTKHTPNGEVPAVQNQQFGNITLELLVRNDRPYRLKLSATSYQDRLFADAQSFKELLDTIVR